MHMAPRWVVTGGAGYIGSHIVRSLSAQGIDVHVIDDFSTGKRERLPEGVTVHVANLLDQDSIRTLLAQIDPEGVVHLAGKKQARESYDIPLEYWSVNVMGTVSLLNAIQEARVRYLLFSSSCSVYGTQSGVNEESAIAPESPYGASKAAAEMLISDVCAASELQAVSLRYFNVIGCADFPQAHDVAADSVVPRMVNAALAGDLLPVYGVDRATPDGSCLRDYLDVRDIADAHGLVVAALREGHDVPSVLNASSGEPVSVLTMAAAVNEAVASSGTRAAGIEELPSHPADPTEIWAAQSPLLGALGWYPRHSLADSVGAHVTSVLAR